MNYDTIILEMLSRIQTLEEKVKTLEETKKSETRDEQTTDNKICMADIRNYIQNLKSNAKEQGETTLVLTAKEIHGKMRLQSRYPMVCNAMRQMMGEKDQILYSPASGYSSTLKIEYYLFDNI